MDFIRRGIQIVRRSWRNREAHENLQARVRRFVYSYENEYPQQLWDYLNKVLGKYEDYADMEEGEMKVTKQDDYTAVEMYCSEVGYGFLFRLISQLLRRKEVEEDSLVAAATLVEYITIELYNLRLSNIGDPRYANFQGITYRGMNVTPEVVDEYRRIANRKDVRQRNFAVPLALLSTTQSRKVMEDYSGDPQSEQMLWVIHIFGLDPELLQLYRERYPDSVVTSICAMPVARISEFAEQEILLRGAFFHIISMRTEATGARRTHIIEMMMLNANRDHGTELSLNEGEKQTQRELFAKMVRASRYAICAVLSKTVSAVESETYDGLARHELEEIGTKELHWLTYDTVSSDIKSESVWAWLGASTEFSYPPHYSKKKLELQGAVRNRDWTKVAEILDSEYDWKRTEWYNIPKILTGDHDSEVREGYTLTHELASSGRPEEGNSHHRAWSTLVEGIRALGVWRTVRTFDADRRSPLDIALENGNHNLVNIFTPDIKHDVPEDVVSDLESQFHGFMEEYCKDLVSNLAKPFS